MGAVIDGDEDHLIAAFREVQLTTDGSMGADIDPFFPPTRPWVLMNST